MELPVAGFYGHCTIQRYPPTTLVFYHHLSAPKVLLSPANEVWGKVIFLEACVKNSVHRRGRGQYLGRYPPGTRYTPWDQVSHQDQVHPPDQVTPPGTRYTPRTRYIPPGTRYTPQTRYPPPPWPGTPRDQVQPPPPEQRRLGNTGNKRAVSILLECILVPYVYALY